MESKEENLNHGLSRDEQLKRCYEIILMNYRNIHNLSNSINIYLAYGCSFLLIYFFNNIETLKNIISNEMLFILILLPVFNIVFSLLQLFVSLKGEIRKLEFMGAKHSYIEKGDERSLEQYKEYRKSNFLEKTSSILEKLSFITTFLIAFGIIYIFYNLIFPKTIYNIIINL